MLKVIRLTNKRRGDEWYFALRTALLYSFEVKFNLRKLPTNASHSPASCMQT
jgi:hypothetical protein